MLKRLIVLFMLMLFTSTALAQNDNRDFNGYLWYNDGIQFTYSLSIAGDGVATFFPAAAGSPEFVKITFQDYHEDTGCRGLVCRNRTKKETHRHHDSITAKSDKPL